MFYTREMPHGRSLDALVLAGEKFGEKFLANVRALREELLGVLAYLTHLLAMPRACINTSD